MLGRLKMTIDECITAFIAFSDHVFQKKAHRVNYNGKLKARFDTAALESSIKNVIFQKGFKEDALLKDAPDSSCKVFVCAMSKETQGTICLTSYRTPGGDDDLLSSVKIWEACRATSAATTFFDPIVIGRYGEEFIDGATGANNPVQQLWNQAERLWGDDKPIDGRVQCIISLGTGSRGLKPFHDDVLGITKSLQELATECARTAELFQQSKPQLDRNGRYFRFDVSHGLEDIGLEESKKKKEIASATRHYMMTGDIFMKIQRFSSGPTLTPDQPQFFNIGLSLHRVPVVNRFIERPVEMAQIESSLLPDPSNTRRKIFVLRGMGGIRKTQLAVEFARCHHHKFTAVFWIDGSSVDNLEQSFRNQLERILGEPAKASSISDDFVIVKKKFLSWLSQTNNNRWLLIFDNVDRDWTSSPQDPLAFDLKEYFPDSDHGTILITTRLARLEQFGSSLHVGTVDGVTAREILELRSRTSYEDADVASLLNKLDGLPLAITQAGAYLAETGVSITKYLELYNASWEELNGLVGTASSPLDDYPNRNIGTTWAISFKAIQQEDQHAANLLLLWSHLDNRDLWFGLLGKRCRAQDFGAQLSICLGDIPTKETTFLDAVRLLKNYSLVESDKKSNSYTTRAVVHQWAYSYHSGQQKLDFEFLACLVTGSFFKPLELETRSCETKRALSHTQPLVSRILMIQSGDSKVQTVFQMNPFGLHGRFWYALSCVTLAFRYSGRLDQARQLLFALLDLSDTTLGPGHVFRLHFANELGKVCVLQGDMGAAERILNEALECTDTDSDLTAHIQLENMTFLAQVYTSQEKYSQAEQVQTQALLTAKVPRHTILPLLGLASTYSRLENFDRAEEIAKEALNIALTTRTEGDTKEAEALSILGNIYTVRKKYSEAENTLIKAVAIYEKHYSPEILETDLEFLMTLQALGECYFKSGNNPDKAREILVRARDGFLKREADQMTLDALQMIMPRLARLELVESAIADPEPTQEAIPELLKAETREGMEVASFESCQTTRTKGRHENAQSASRWRSIKQKILK